MSPARIVRLDQLEQFLAINVLSDPGAIGGPVTAPLCMEVKIGWGAETAKTAYNVCHARYVGSYPGTAAMADAILTALKASYTSTTLATFQPTTSSLFNVQLRDINTANNPYVSSTGLASNGTSAAAALPAETALVLTLRTAKTGPSGRGRIYIPNWAANALAAGNVCAAAAVTAAGSFGTAIRNAINAQGVTMCLALPARQAYTGSTGTPHPARAAQTIDVTQVVARNNTWDSQRRRGLK